jgi:hypothetical protein
VGSQAGWQHDGSQQVGSQQVGAQHLFLRHILRKKPRIRCFLPQQGSQHGSQQAGSQQAGSQQAGSQQAGSQQVGSQQVGWQQPRFLNKPASALLTFAITKPATASNEKNSFAFMGGSPTWEQ